MSKTDALRQMIEGDTGQRLNEVAELMEEIHTRKVRSAEELAQLLEPLAKAMLDLTATTTKSLAATVSESKELKERFLQQVNESRATWNQGIRAGDATLTKIRETQAQTAKLMHDIEEAARETARNAQKTRLLIDTGRWVYPILTVLLVTLFLAGFALWQMPDYATLTYNQSAIYELLKKVEEKATPPGQVVKK